MGYFDSVFFGENLKTDGQGRELFFPWGEYGRGYLMTEYPRRQQVRRFLYWSCFLAVLIYAVGNAALVSAGAPGGGLVLLPLFALCYHRAHRPLLRGLPVAQERRSLAVIHADKAKTISFGALLFVFCACTLIVWEILRTLSRSPTDVGLILVFVFFNVFTWSTGYMIQVKSGSR
ncbi:MAG: hypothetical protein V4671_24870 [Armatimonadota bacterium]